MVLPNTTAIRIPDKTSAKRPHADRHHRLDRAAALTAPVSTNELQEIDLAGNVVYQLTQYQIDQGLTAAGLPVPGYLNLNHDVLKLPNGHYMLLVSGVQTVNGWP